MVDPNPFHGLGTWTVPRSGSRKRVCDFQVMVRRFNKMIVSDFEAQMKMCEERVQDGFDLILFTNKLNNYIAKGQEAM